MDFLHEIKGKNSFLFNTVQLFSKKTLRESIFKSCYGKATSQCRRRRARTRPHRVRSSIGHQQQCHEKGKQRGAGLRLQSVLGKHRQQHDGEEHHI